MASGHLGDRHQPRAPDYGQGGVFTGGNGVADDNGFLDDENGALQDAGSETFQEVKAATFNPVRLGEFHYVVVDAFSNTGELSGNDVELGNPCGNTNHLSLAGTIMHELGHNLGLEHDGRNYPWRAVNYVPNYNSVMNYLYDQGVDTDCDGVGDGVLDYSYGTRPDLDESNLSETEGMCDGPDQGTGRDPIDWDGNGVYYGWGVVHDINDDGKINVTYPDAVLPLKDHDDWAHIRDSETGGLNCIRTCAGSEN